MANLNTTFYCQFMLLISVDQLMALEMVGLKNWLYNQSKFGFSKIFAHACDSKRMLIYVPLFAKSQNVIHCYIYVQISENQSLKSNFKINFIAEI